MVRTGAPVLYQPDEILEPQHSTGRADGLAGKDVTPPAHYLRAERIAYYQGHIQGALQRRRNRLSNTLDARKDTA